MRAFTDGKWDDRGASTGWSQSDVGRGDGHGRGKGKVAMGDRRSL